MNDNNNDMVGVYFSGPLSHGICEEKLMLLQDEAFLYLSTAPVETEEDLEVN